MVSFILVKKITNCELFKYLSEYQRYLIYLQARTFPWIFEKIIGGGWKHWHNFCCQWNTHTSSSIRTDLKEWLLWTTNSCWKMEKSRHCFHKQFFSRQFGILPNDWMALYRSSQICCLPIWRCVATLQTMSTGRAGRRDSECIY